MSQICAEILRYQNCAGTDTVPGDGFRPSGDNCSSSEHQRMWRLGDNG